MTNTDIRTGDPKEENQENSLTDSEDKYSQLFNKMLDGCAIHEIICDDDGNPCDYRFLDVNPAFEKFTGIRRENAIGKTVLEILPETEKRWIESYGKVALTGESIHIENYHKELDKYFEVVAFCPQKGQFAVTFTDITERRRAEKAVEKARDDLEIRVEERTRELRDEIAERKQVEEALRENEARYRGLHDSLPVGVVYQGANGEILSSNPASHQILRLSEDQLHGRTSEDPGWMAVREDGAPFPGNEHPAMVSLATGQSQHDVIMGLRYPEKTIWISINSMPLFKPDETEPYGVITSFNDVTARKRAEERMRAAFIEAEKANRAKTDFLSSMSHELRTPLNAIIGFSSFMQEEIFGSLDNEKYREYVDDISKSGNHLLELISDILDASAMELGKLELNEEKVDVDEVIGTSLNMVNAHANDENVRLVSHIDAGLPTLYADKRRIMQILLNLLSNAIKFTHSEGEIVISASLNGGKGHVFTVRDTGVGMNDEDLGKAMSEFGQVDSGFNRIYDGAGLGLPLTQGLVELHGGNFQIESEEGVGTTVTVSFPPDRTQAA